MAVHSTFRHTPLESADMNAIDIIKRDHEAAKDLFARYRAAGEEERTDMEEEIFDALTAHEIMEDKHFYPMLRKANIDEAGLFSDIEGEQVKLAAEVTAARTIPGDKQERILSIMDTVLAHAAKEEAEILPKAEAVLTETELDGLGLEMEPDSAVAKSKG